VIKIDITNSKLFDSLLDISYEKSSHYDLHNDFDLKSINYEKLNNIFIFNFIEIKGKRIVSLVFEDVKILSFNLPVNEKDLTLDNFHRGRFEYENQLYDEYNSKKCFYMEFYEEGNINFLCSKATLEIKTHIKVINFKA